MKFIFALVTIILFFNNTCFAQNDTSDIIKLDRIAWELRTSNPDSSIALSNKALNLLNKKSQKNTFSKNWKEQGLAKTYYYLGVFYRYKDEQKTALEYFAKALSISTNNGFEFITSQTYGGIGNIYIDQGAFPKALEYYLKALQIDEKRGFKKGIATHLANIGNIYEDKHDAQKALEYYTKALNIALEINDEERVAIQLGNIGVVYNTLNDLPKALEFYIKALNLNKKINNKIETANNLSNISSIYKDEKQYAKSLDYLNQSLAIDSEIGTKSGISFGNIGVVYFLMKDYKKAEKYLIKAITISEEMNDIESLQEFEETLSKVYSKQGKNELAFKHYKKQILYRDSMYNEDNTKKIVSTEMNYEFDKKQAVTKFENDKVVYKLEAENKLHKQVRVFFIICIILFLVLLFFAKRAYDNKKKIAEFMASENSRKEVLLQEVHHRINNNLQIISSLLTLQANSADDEKLHNYLKQSQNRIQSLSVLHELLYQNESPLQINMNDYLNKVLDFHRDVLNTLPNKVDIYLNISAVDFTTKIAVPLALIVNELVTNSIKYAFNDGKDGQITISLLPIKKEKNKWNLIISDSGKGLPMDPDFRKDSLGLRLVTIMTKQIKGTLTKSNAPGATFEIVFASNV